MGILTIFDPSWSPITENGVFKKVNDSVSKKVNDSVSNKVE